MNSNADVQAVVFDAIYQVGDIDVASLSLDQELFEAGGLEMDSLEVVDVLSIVENTLGIAIPSNKVDFESLRTVGDLVGIAARADRIKR